MNTEQVDAVVTGGAGLIGRWLLAELTARGRSVAAIVRNARGREEPLRAFVDAHGGDSRRLLVTEGDVEAPALGLDERFEGVRDVFHLAARFAFGLDPSEARRCNVTGALNAAEWALGRPRLRRFVYLGGYRMTVGAIGLKSEGYPLSEAARERLYREHGAYEASKHESYRALRAFAAARALPFSAVHPSSVIGDSRTGETTQTTGLGDTVQRLWEGQMPALVGTANTFVPVVTVDYLARFLATVPERDETAGQDLCVLDPATPTLPALVQEIAAHLGVPAPTRVLPTGLVRALPQRITGVDPESLSFLSEDRYDTTSAEEHAAAIGLSFPPLQRSLRRWCDYLISTRFGAEDAADRGELRESTYCVGDPGSADIVYLHGLPWNGDSWKPVADRGPGPHARLDLPGLGRSRPTDLDDAAWLDGVLGARLRPVVLVGHSLGAGIALRYAHAHPGKVAGLVLVSPSFLQRAASAHLRVRPLVACALRRSTPTALGARLLPEATGAVQSAPAVISACADLRRKGVARRAAYALARASSSGARAELRRKLAEIVTPTLIIHGSADPLVASAGAHPVHVVSGAGHNPHLTRAAEVARLVEAFAAELCQRSRQRRHTDPSRSPAPLTAPTTPAPPRR